MIRIQTDYTAGEIAITTLLIVGASILFCYLGATAADKEQAFNDNIRHARCERSWMSGYCHGIDVPQENRQ